MTREIQDILAWLVDKARWNHGAARPADLASFWRAMQQMPADEMASIIGEMTAGRLTVVPSVPPQDWNEAKKRGYRILLKQAFDRMTKEVADAIPRKPK